MSTPTIIFDHISKTVTVSSTTDAEARRRLADFAAAAQSQASSTNSAR